MKIIKDRWWTGDDKHVLHEDGEHVVLKGGDNQPPRILDNVELTGFSLVTEEQLVDKNCVILR